MRKKTNIISFTISTIIKSLMISVVVMILVGYLLGYRAILVNGWSSEPKIHYQSLIVTEKKQLSKISPGDFLTYTYSGASHITHQVIAVKTDGTFFEVGKTYTVLLNGKTYDNFVYGYKFSNDGQPTAEVDSSAQSTTKCNIIVMQHQFDSEGNMIISADKEYLNFATNIEGKVVYSNYTIGSTIFIVRSNAFILVGLFSCLILVFVMRDQFSIEPKFFE